MHREHMPIIQGAFDGLSSTAVSIVMLAVSTIDVSVFWDAVGVVKAAWVWWFGR